MISQQDAITIARERLRSVYPDCELLKATYSDALEEFDSEISGWRVWFRVKDEDFGTYDRPVEVSDDTHEARLVKIMM
jgi:hypothetical protein